MLNIKSSKLRSGGWIEWLTKRPWVRQALRVRIPPPPFTSLRWWGVSLHVLPRAGRGPLILRLAGQLGPPGQAWSGIIRNSECR
jgi:hypothetical protein